MDRKPWWQREPHPAAYLGALWLVAVICVVAHYTRAKLNFDNQGGGQDEPVTWWVIGFWTLMAAIPTVRYARSRRRRDRPGTGQEGQVPEPPAGQDRFSQ
jgi:membrane protease YdiL (CAAX protease family)